MVDIVVSGSSSMTYDLYMALKTMKS